MATSRIEGDQYFAGNVEFKAITLNSGAVTNAMVNSSAAIATTKMRHRHNLVYNQNGTAATETVPIFICSGAVGEIVSIKAATIAACSGAATITIDLKKGGTTCLSSVITLDNANTARTSEAGTLSVTTLAVGNFLELVVTATAGGGTLGTGLIVEVVVDEDAN